MSIYIETKKNIEGQSFFEKHHRRQDNKQTWNKRTASVF